MDSQNSFFEAVEECVLTHNGMFQVDVSGWVPEEMVIRSAVVSLLPDEIGIVDEILIIGPDGQIELECFSIKVENGTDLIRECGKVVILQPGETRYRASGSNFEPSLETKFCISLSN